MQFGATVWTFQWQPPYESAIRRIARLGYRSVELIAWSPEALAEYYTPDRICELRNILEGEGLTLNEFVATPPGMASPDAGIRNAAVEYTKHVIEVAQALGTQTINHVSPTPFGLQMPHLMRLPTSQIWTVDLPADTPLDWDANFQSYAEIVRGITGLLEPAGMRLAIEPHPYRWVSSAASFLRLVDAVRSPALGFNFDPSHLFPCGDMPQISVYMAGSRVFNTHFSDNDGVTNAHWRPGRGKIDWQLVMRALHDVGYDGTIAIELEDVPGVSRPNQESTPALDEQYRLSSDYIRKVAEGLDIRWQ